MPRPTETKSGELDFYADATNGDDAKSGKDASEPKKSLQAVIDLVPYFVNHNVRIHLSGTFQDTTVTIERFVSEGRFLVVDGGTTTSTIEGPLNGDFVGSQLSNVRQNRTPVNWKQDHYVGYWIEVLSGPAKGHTRMIQANDSHSITPVKDFEEMGLKANLGLEGKMVGTTFKIVQPSTEVTKATIVLRNLGGGYLHVQNLTASGESDIWTQKSPGPVSFSHVVVSSNGKKGLDNLFKGAFFGISSNLIELIGSRYNCDTAWRKIPVTDEFSHAGVSQIGTNNVQGMVFMGVPVQVKVSASYATILHFYRATPNIGEGSRALRLLLYGVNCYTTTPGLTGGIRDSSKKGYATTKFGGDLSIFGVKDQPRRASVAVFNSSVTIMGAVDLSTPQDFGLEVVGNSFVYVMGDRSTQPPTQVSLTGTAKAVGLYIHGNSCLHIAEGTRKPTLTGGTGGSQCDISTQIEYTTKYEMTGTQTTSCQVKSQWDWAKIMNTPATPPTASSQGKDSSPGTPLTDPAEMVTVKNYGIYP